MRTDDICLDQDVRERFMADGFVRLEGLASEADRAILGEIYDRCFREHAAELHLKALGGVRDGRQLLPQVFKPSELFPEINELAYVRRVEALARHLLGPEVFRRGESMILKPAHYGAPTPWHQDQAYHPPEYDYRNINFWLPVDGADVASGCLHFVPGSHQGLIVPHRRAGGEEEASAAEALDQDYWSRNGVAVPCAPGDVTLHHSYCLHYAGPNRTDRPRRAYILVFALPPRPRARPWQLPWLEELHRS